MGRPPEQERVGRRIIEIEGELVSLKTSFNSYSPVNQVPNEILSNIFALVANAIPEELSTYLSDRESAKWLRVTHVCRHWRSIAMASGSLWSNINFVTPELANAMLERSRSAPLSVQLFYNSPKFTNTLARILAQVGRIQSANLTGLMEKKVLSKFSKAAPILEDLVLQFAGYKPTNLPIDFLQEGAPKLRRLVVEGFGILQWVRFPLFPSLTHLRLRSSNWGETRPPAKAFLEHLKQMPHLRTLDLVAFLPYPNQLHSPTSTCLPCKPSVSKIRWLQSVASRASCGCQE